jgi:hypothetical protein
VERLVPRGVEPGGAEFPHLRQQRLAQLAPLHLAVADGLAHGGGFRALHHGIEQLGFLVQAREGHAVPVDQHHVGALAHCQRAQVLAEGRGAGAAHPGHAQHLARAGQAAGGQPQYAHGARLVFQKDAGKQGGLKS